MDVIAELAYPLAFGVIAALLGIPDDDRHRFQDWSDGLMRFGNDAGTRAASAVADMSAYFTRLAATRRRHPCEDLVSRLSTATEGEDVLSEDELVAQCVGILVAGYETTTAALGSVALAARQDPQAWHLLGRRPDQTGALVEEILRLAPPFQHARRTVRADFAWHGQPARAGDPIIVWIAAANRDPTSFADPDRLDPTRASAQTRAPHLAFGHGVHYCLGAALARSELDVALSTLHRRYPRLQLSSVDWRAGGAVHGPQTLRAILDADSRWPASHGDRISD